MLFGKHINRYYLRHLPALLLGVLALVMIDVFQLEIPKLYGGEVALDNLICVAPVIRK